MMYWFSLVHIGFVGKTHALSKNDYGNSGLFYAWCLAPKIKYGLVIDDFDIFPAE